MHSIERICFLFFFIFILSWEEGAGYSRLPVPPIISSHKHVTGVIFALRGIHMHDVKPSKKTGEGKLLCISLMHAVGSSPPPRWLPAHVLLSYSEIKWYTGSLKWGVNYFSRALASSVPSLVVRLIDLSAPRSHELDCN